MLRGEWKDREDDEENEDKGEVEEMDLKEDTVLPFDEGTDGSDQDTNTNPTPNAQTQARSSSHPAKVKKSRSKSKPNARQTQAGTAETEKKVAVDDKMDTLANSMTSLSLVPPSIRFGRGGKSGGFGGATVAETQNQKQKQSGTPQYTNSPNHNAILGRGRGRGGARGAAFIPNNLNPNPSVNGSGNHNIPTPVPVAARVPAAGSASPGRAGLINVSALPGRGVRSRGGPKGRHGSGSGGGNVDVVA